MWGWFSAKVSLDLSKRHNITRWFTYMYLSKFLHAKVIRAHLFLLGGT